MDNASGERSAISALRADEVITIIRELQAENRRLCYEIDCLEEDKEYLNAAYCRDASHHD